MARSVIDVPDLSLEELTGLMDTAEDIIGHPDDYADACRRKKLATLFFEPSTRTRLSFEAAMYELGGNVLSVTGAGTSSAAKGESVADTAKTVSCYADIIAMRHPKEGAALVAAKAASVPVINAGDGGHCHPTQTLADLLTIRREKGRLGDLTVGLCGDLKFGRTVHSLINAMSRYEGLKFVLISPEELKVPSYVKNESLKKRGIPYEQTTDLEQVIGKLDILYMTRVQRERFFNEEDYLRLGMLFQTGAEREVYAHGADSDAAWTDGRCSGMNVDSIRDGIVIDHISAGNGMKLYRLLGLEGLDVPVAMITNVISQKRGRKDIIKIDADIPVNFDVIGYVDPGATVNVIRHGELSEKKQIGMPERLTNVLFCKNPRCITSCEQEIEHVFRLSDRGKKEYRCIWCETKAAEL